MSDSKSISVWVEHLDQDKVSVLPSIEDITRSTTEVSANVLAKNFQCFVKNFLSILDKQEYDESSYEMQSIELNLSVNAKGGIELIGKLSAGVTTSMKVHLIRKK